MTSFRSWIRQCESEDTPVGDLARDIAHDAAFPRVRTLGGLVAHLNHMGACEGAISAAQAAWTRYTMDGAGAA